MARETEIKLRISDVKAFHRALKRLGARPVGTGSGRVHEENVIFDTPQGGLAKHGQLLRIRTETHESHAKSKRAEPKQRVVLTFKQPPARAADAGTDSAAQRSYKVREEIELEVADPGNLRKIFEGLGMTGWFRYEKYRSTFTLPASKAWARGLLIELDETPIGTFAELEGPAQAIDRAAEELGFSKRDYVLKNYLVLYMEECRRKGEEPRHMLFTSAKIPSKVAPGKKNRRISHSFLDNATSPAYQFTLAHFANYTCVIAEGADPNGVDTLSMSASSELEPGPSRSGPYGNQNGLPGPVVQTKSLGMGPAARAVRWGGPPGG